MPNMETPYYIYDESILNNQIDKLLKTNIKNYNIHFSIMANNNINLVKIIMKKGIGVFASSITELEIALKIGFKNNQIVFCSSNLKKHEIEFVAKVNPIIVAGSLIQLNKYISYGNVKEIVLRVSFSPEFYKKYGELEIQRQGIEIGNFNVAVDYCSKKNVKIIGIHSYLGTNITNVNIYKEGISLLLNLSKGLTNIKFFDISGGFGLDYMNKDADFNIGYLSEYFYDELSMQTFSNSIELKIEPGRFIIAPAGKLICSVTEIFEKDNKVFIGVDTNLANFPRPYIYKHQHLITVYQRKNDIRKMFSNVFICGNSAKSDDFFAQDISFPFVEEGDTLCFHYAGAYSYSMSSNFCALLKPSEYLLNKESSLIKIRDRENIETLLTNQNLYEE